MTNTQQTAKSETTNPTDIEDTDDDARRCCGGPAPAGADACCVQDAEAKAAGETGCGCRSNVSAAKASRCC